MENIFSPTRFGNLVNKHFREHLRTYLMSMLVLGALILGFFTFTIVMSHRAELTISTQLIVCCVSILLGMFIFTGSIFSDYNHPRSAFTATMLPASVFEKYLLYWLISLIGFTVLALGVYHLSQAIIIEYLKTKDAEVIRFWLWNVSDATPPTKWLLIAYLLFHSIAFLGSIAFKKRTVIITAMVAFVIIGAYIYLNYRLSLVALNGNSIPFPFVRAGIQTEQGWATIEYTNNELWATISLSTLIILFWISAFFKLKERQV